MLTRSHLDTPLGRWTHTQWAPDEDSPLAGLIDHIWHFDGKTSWRRERVFPNGRLEIIVHLDDRYRLLEGKGPELCGVTGVTGLQLGPMLIEAPERSCRVIGIRLHPLGARAVLGLPLTEVAGLNVDLPDLVGAEGDRLGEECASAPSAEAAIDAAARWSAARMAGSFARMRPEQAAAWAAREIARRGGAVSVTELRERTGASKSRLTSAFRDLVGVTPKLYARIHRFSRTLSRLGHWPGTLSELAQECGYYDQPHMNAEFRALSGLAPREFLTSIRYPGSVSLAE
jgi:AraC-like DNA-binding protein